MTSQADTRPFAPPQAASSPATAPKTDHTPRTFFECIDLEPCEEDGAPLSTRRSNRKRALIGDQEARFKALVVEHHTRGDREDDTPAHSRVNAVYKAANR
jgi:hypothetical protein